MSGAHLTPRGDVDLAAAKVDVAQLQIVVTERQGRLVVTLVQRLETGGEQLTEGHLRFCETLVCSLKYRPRHCIGLQCNHLCGRRRLEIGKLVKMSTVPPFGVEDAKLCDRQSGLFHGAAAHLITTSRRQREIFQQQNEVIGGTILFRVVTSRHSNGFDLRSNIFIKLDQLCVCTCSTEETTCHRIIGRETSNHKVGCGRFASLVADGETRGTLASGTTGGRVGLRLEGVHRRGLDVAAALEHLLQPVGTETVHAGRELVGDREWGRCTSTSTSTNSTGGRRMSRVVTMTVRAGVRRAVTVTGFATVAVAVCCAVALSCCAAVAVAMCPGLAATAVSSLREHADLLQEAHIVVVHPALHDLARLQTVDGNPRGGDRLVAGRDRHERLVVKAGATATYTHTILAAGEHVQQLLVHVLEAVRTHLTHANQHIDADNGATLRGVKLDFWMNALKHRSPVLLVDSLKVLAHHFRI
mmetsp:Transcript_11300/g.28503  ORF Transcript_11300/g.28503 Transcript_11300/m.28503 type:complete len:471 (+) Transcript_11300:407-1819(+)